jgi:SAM-dependent methyltransferase
MRRRARAVSKLRVRPGRRLRLALPVLGRVRRDSCLAHHHYPDPKAAASEVFRCLRPGGLYCVVDPGPAWFNALSAPLGRLADPGWIGWQTPEGFRALMEEAGFARTCWIPLLPGFGLAVGQKPSSIVL